MALALLTESVIVSKHPVAVAVAITLALSTESVERFILNSFSLREEPKDILNSS